MTYTVGTSINFKSPTINIGQTEYGLLGSSLYPNGTSDIKLRAGHAIQLMCDDVTCQQDLYVTRALSVNNDFGQPGQVLMSNGINNAMSWTTLNSASTDSPEFTGTPTAPTASAGDSSTQLATTAFVTTAVENLVGGAPGALDTLNELAAAINDDENYAASITTALATKQSSITESSRLSATYVGDGNVDNSEFGHLNGVTGNIQTQLDNKQANLTFGIADTNAVKIDDANVISAGNYAIFTANGIEGRSYDEVKSDLSLNNVENTALSTWPGSGNIVNVGSISLEKLDQVNYTVKTITKTSLHPYYGDASNSGYEINGHEAAILMFVPGKTYRFDMSDSSNQGHPLKFYLDVDKNTGYTNNVTESGTAGNSNAYVEIVITDSTPTKIFYQCGNHPKMGNYGLVKGYANLGNINVNENTITSTDSNGNINISPDGTGVVKITSNVETSGTLLVDVITSKTTDSNVSIYPLGTGGTAGNIILQGLTWPAGDGTD